MEGLKLYTRRSGVIAYVRTKREDGSIGYIMLMGRHKSGDLCDFGGRTHTGEDAKTLAAREFNEETKRIFGSSASRLSYTNCITDGKNNTLFFLELHATCLLQARGLFHATKARCREEEEMKDIVWISLEDLVESAVHGRGVNKIWSVISNLLIEFGGPLPLNGMIHRPRVVNAASYILNEPFGWPTDPLLGSTSA